MIGAAFQPVAEALANICALALCGASSGAYAIAIIEPFDVGDTPLRRPCTSDDTPPVKSISARSACASAVGSSVANRVPACTAGPLKPLAEKVVFNLP